MKKAARMLASAPTGDDKQNVAATTDLRDCQGAAAQAGWPGLESSEAPAERTGASEDSSPGHPPPHPTTLKTALANLICRARFWVAAALLGVIAVGLTLASAQVRGWYHLRAARSELEHYHNPGAVRHLQVCLRTWPDDADVLLLAARAARRARSYAEAERLLERYQQVRGCDDAFSFEELLLSAERRVDEVADTCWRYVEQGQPNTPLILEALTQGYLRQYRLGQARMCLDRWLREQPDNPQAYCLEGLFHLDYAHAKSAAEQSYRRAVELDPGHEEAHLGLAVTLLDAKNYPEAALHLEYVRQRQPDNLSVQVGLAECRDGQGEATEAVRLVERVFAQQPDFAPALALRGRLALESGQTEKAETWLRQAIARNPSDHHAHYNLMQCLHHTGKEAEAQRHRQQLKQMEDDLKRFDEIVTRELVQTPYDPALHCTLGQLLLHGGQHQEGLRWLQSALRLDPQYAPARRALAEYYKKGSENREQRIENRE